MERKAFRCVLLCKTPPLLAEIKRSIERNPGYWVVLELDLELAVFDEPRCISAAGPRPFQFYAFVVYMWTKSLANITYTVAMRVPDRIGKTTHIAGWAGVEENSCAVFSVWTC